MEKKLNLVENGKLKKINKFAIAIPILNPNDEFVSFVNSLVELGFKRIIIVDDGSDEEYDEVFEELSTVSQCDVLTHIVNMGKGRALKDALNYYLVQYSEKFDGVITVDGDGQYLVDDIIKLVNKINKYPESMIIGVRNFYTKNVPFKSFFGNLITKYVFKLFVGGKLKDTQSALRLLPNAIIYDFLKLNGERYEFETNSLIYAVQNGFDIKQVNIHTIYSDKNKNSYFKPFTDSLIIYSLIFSTFIKFSVTSMMAFAVDYMIFCFLGLTLSIDNLSYRIFISAFIARIISTMLNYYLTKTLAFNNKTSDKAALFKYYGLCLLQLIASANIVIFIVNHTGSSEYSVKILVDLFLFFVSYAIQKKFIFANN